MMSMNMTFSTDHDKISTITSYIIMLKVNEDIIFIKINYAALSSARLQHEGANNLMDK